MREDREEKLLLFVREYDRIRWFFFMRPFFATFAVKSFLQPAECNYTLCELFNFFDFSSTPRASFSL
jgi:hypothetical protein